jgi:hypothetical protein
MQTQITSFTMYDPLWILCIQLSKFICTICLGENLQL